MSTAKAIRFSHALVRVPGASVCRALSSSGGPAPDVTAFTAQHQRYVQALVDAGLAVTVLPALEAFPDAVFVEDAALCIGATAIALRPGATSRRGESQALRPALTSLFRQVIDLPGPGSVDGGDVLLTGKECLVGISARTDAAGFDALAEVLAELGYPSRRVITPADVLHFKSDCGLLDDETVYATPRLAASGCFSGYRVIETPAGEEASANLVRINDQVLLSDGHPRAAARLDAAGYRVSCLDISQAARADGGLSCMSLRFAPGNRPRDPTGGAGSEAGEP